MNNNLLKICFVTALLASATAAYSADITGSTSIGGGTFSPSNKVNIQAIATDTHYSAQSKHVSGDRELGTNNTDPKIHYSTAEVGSFASAPETASVDYSGWTTL